MSSTKQLEWRIDSREYERFREFVGEKHGVVALCFPSEVTQAMRAFIDKDRAADVEERLDALEDVLADSFAGYSRRRRSSDPLAADDLGGEDTTKIRCEVPAELKEEFAIYVDENSEWGYGEALGRAMNAYRDGGREQRLADQLDAMTVAVEAVDVDAQDTDQGTESDDESESRPYSKEEKLEEIRRDLAEANRKDSAEEIQQLPRKQIVQAIHRYCSQEPDEPASDRTVNNYLGRIKEELELTDDPQNDVLLIKDDGMDGPAFEYKDFANLSTEERVEAVRVKLLQKADSGRGGQVSAADIQTEFFGGEPSDSVAHDLRNRAAEAEGFAVRTARDGVKTVRVNIPEVSDESLLDAAGLVDHQATEAEAAAEMDALMNAQQVRTDGGSGLSRRGADVPGV